MTNEQRFIYGYGSTKHLPGWKGGPRTEEYGLCGAAGGYPISQPGRPTCKRCLKKAEKS